METLGHFFTWAVGLLRRGGWRWGVVVSLAAAAGSVALAVVIVVGWAPDRFKVDGPVSAGPRRPALLRLVGGVAKNLAGVVLVLLGILMAIPGVPGQGLLTALIGITLLSFPGKRRIERRFVRLPRLLGGINRLRARFDRPPLELD
jgi:hypothetical protein